MSDRFSLLPHAQTDLVSHAEAPAPGRSRLRLPYELEIQADDAAQGARLQISSELRGPGDIISVERDMVTRVEPRPGLRAFETSYLPFVEFADADFPWRYSFDPPGGKRRRPWLALVALRDEEFSFVEHSSAPRASIRVDNAARSLPDLSQSWATAHVQLSLDEETSTAEVLADRPGQSFSRLLCPRRLVERSSYTLMLVPAYEAGRLAGLGRPEGAAPHDAPAWQQSPEPTELPVYLHWSFNTDTLEDLEVMMRRLRGVTRDEVAGVGAAQSASAADPGYYPDYANPDATFQIQCALRPGARPGPAYDTDPALADRMASTLNQVIAGGGGEDAGEEENDPLVAFPPYGFRFRPGKDVSPERAGRNAWFDRINLDLKYRLAAGAGASLVRENQEMFLRQCWEQFPNLAAINAERARLQTSEVLVKALREKHFSRLPDHVALSIAEPAQPFARAGGATVAQTLRDTGTPGSFASRDMRRLAAKRSTRGLRPGQTTVPMPNLPDGQDHGDTAVQEADRFPPAATALMQTLFGASGFDDIARARSRAVPVIQADAQALSRPIGHLLQALPKAKSQVRTSGLTAFEQADLKPVWRTPVLDRPLGDMLGQQRRRVMLSGMDKLPDNSVALFQENRPFIEAFLLGANHAINAELRWREFPTDMRGTVFSRFWSRSGAAGDAAPGGPTDIAPINSWKRRLGRNHDTADGTPNEKLIVVIRGDVVRKLGAPLALINIADGPAWKAGEGRDHSPVLVGTMGRDLAYFGFDLSRRDVLARDLRHRLFFVLMEPVGGLRFGLDVSSAEVRAKRQGTAGLGYAFPMQSVRRAYRPLPPSDNLSAPFEAPGPPSDWGELSWSHMRLTESGHIDFSKTIAIEGAPNYWGRAKTSASVARSFLQQPIAAVLPLSRVL
ncbi:MAG: hypothetical protein AAF503_03220 [Pseudomonadota bacterium]